MIEDIVYTYSKELTAIGIQHEIVEHPELKSIGDVLGYLQLSFADCMPTLIMKADNSFIAMVIRGDCRTDFKKVKKQMGIKDLRMATPDEFLELTGLPVGTARVYTPAAAKTYLDHKLFEQEYLHGGSGSFSCSIKYKTADLTKITNSFIEDITI